MSGELSVVFLFPRWEVSGVTSVNLDLAAALRDLGVRCLFVVEEDNRDSCPYELPPGIPCINLSDCFQWWNLSPSRSLGARLRHYMMQRRLRRILSGAGSVALIPGYAHSLAMPKTSWGPHVGIFGVVHAEDAANVDFAVHHGREWAACICVSGRVAERVRTAAPWLGPVVVQNGVPCAAEPPVGRRGGEVDSLRVVYAGRLEQKQKRVRDLAALVELVAQKGFSVTWEIAGEGTEAPALHERLRPFIESGVVRWHGSLPRQQVRRLFSESDVMLLLSDYEGMPMVLLEAMAEGCVPVVTEGCDAGADLVRRHDAGLVLPTGDVQRFADALRDLASNREQLAKLGERAWNAVAHGEHNSMAMGKACLRLISERHPALASSRSPGKSI